MIKIAGYIYYIIFFLLFIFGAVRSLLVYKKEKTSKNFIRLICIIIYLVPFAVFLAAGFFGIKFGGTKNFFYLLPIYVLVGFFSLDIIIKNKKFYYIAAVLLVTAMLYAGLKAAIIWDVVNLEKEMIKQAGLCGSKAVVVYTRYPAEWAFHHYSGLNKIKFISYVQEGSGLGSWKRLLLEMRVSGDFVIVKRPQHKLLFKNRLFKIRKTKYVPVSVTPYYNLAKLLRYPVQEYLEICYAKKTAPINE